MASLGSIRYPRSCVLIALTLGFFTRVSAANALTSVTVLPFAPRAGESQAWISKGLADLLTQHLSQIPTLKVLEREELQAFLKEMELGDAPLFDQQSALRVGHVTKVQQGVYGSYQLTGSKIQITAFWLDLDRQVILCSADVNGPKEDLVRLAHQLTEDLLRQRGAPVSAEALAKLKIQSTDSFSALEHFYRGMDFQDRGQFPQALGEFLTAAQRDAQFLDAQLWTGLAYEAQGSDEHAVLAFHALSKHFPERVEAWDALSFAAKILSEHLHAPARALLDWRMVERVAPETPQALEASYQAGQCLEQQSDPAGAYRAYCAIERIRQRLHAHDARKLEANPQTSRFFSWDHALGLVPEASAKSILLFDQLVQRREFRKETPPRGTFIVDSKQPVIQELFGKTPSLFINDRENIESGHAADWREETYAVIVPPGYEATGVSMELTGRLWVSRPDRDFSMRIYPFPIPRDPQQGWIGVLYGQTMNVQTLRKTVSFHGENRRIFTLQFFQSQAEILHWKIHVHLQPISGNTSETKPASEDSPGFWEGKVISEIALSSETRTAATRPLTQSFYRPQRDLALAQDGKGRVTVVALVGDVDSADADLWTASGEPGKPWTPLQPLPINSRSMDWSPRLARGEDGRLRLAWISNRRGLGWELYTSVQDPGGRWSGARRVPTERWAVSQNGPRNDPEKLLDYALFQDRRGRWLVAYGTSSGVNLLVSPDFESWSLFSQIQTGSLHGFALTQDRTERFILAGWLESGALHLWSSNDAKKWSEQSMTNASLSSPVAHRLEILPTLEGPLWFVYSDKNGGPRAFQWTSPESPIGEVFPLPRTRLESLAAASLDDGNSAVVFREQDRLVVRVYSKFITQANGQRSDFSRFVGQERESDTEGNVWTRAFPTARFIVPDVTAVATESGPSAGTRDSRVWFGIETGIFFHQGDQFEKTDVTQGFFDHFVTDIAACKALPIYFASRERKDAILGVAVETAAGHRFSTERVTGAQGSVTGLACGKAPGQLFVDTSEGQTWRLDSGYWTAAERSLGPTAQRSALLKRIKNPVYASIGPIAEDPRGGLWYLPDDAIPSKGVAYFNGQSTRLFNPPHETLRAPSSLAVDNLGTVWIGTWFNGLYKLETIK